MINKQKKEKIKGNKEIFTFYIELLIFEKNLGNILAEVKTESKCDKGLEVPSLILNTPFILIAQLLLHDACSVTPHSVRLHGLQPARLLCPRDIPQEHWSRLHFLSPGDLPEPGMEPEFLALAGGLLTTAPPGKPAF